MIALSRRYTNVEQRAQNFTSKYSTVSTNLPIFYRSPCLQSRIDHSGSRRHRNGDLWRHYFFHIFVQSLFELERRINKKNKRSSQSALTGAVFLFQRATDNLLWPSPAGSVAGIAITAVARCFDAVMLVPFFSIGDKLPPRAFPAVCLQLPSICALLHCCTIFFCFRHNNNIIFIQVFVYIVLVFLFTK